VYWIKSKSMEAAGNPLDTAGRGIGSASTAVIVLRDLWGLYHKTYYGRNLRISVIS